MDRLKQLPRLVQEDCLAGEYRDHFKNLLEDQYRNARQLPFSLTIKQLQTLDTIFDPLVFKCDFNQHPKSHYIPAVALLLGQEILDNKTRNTSCLIIGGNFKDYDSQRHHWCWKLDGRDETRIVKRTLDPTSPDLNPILKRDKGRNFCTEGTQICHAQKKVGYMNNVYDISMSDLLQTFDNHGLDMLHVAMMLPEEITYGFYGQGTGYRVVDKGDKIAMHFDCCSHAYQHEKKVWIDWCTRAGVNGPYFNLSIERVQRIGPLWYLNVIRCHMAVDLNVFFTSKFNDYVAIYDFMEDPQALLREIRSLDLTTQSGINSAKKFLSQKPRILIPKDIHAKNIQQGLVKSDSTFHNRHFIFAMLKSSSSRVTVSDYVLQNGFEMSAHDFHVVATSLYIETVVLRQIETRAIGNIISILTGETSGERILKLITSKAKDLFGMEYRFGMKSAPAAKIAAIFQCKAIEILSRTDSLTPINFQIPIESEAPVDFGYAPQDSCLPYCIGLAKEGVPNDLARFEGMTYSDLNDEERRKIKIDGNHARPVLTDNYCKHQIAYTIIQEYPRGDVNPKWAMEYERYEINENNFKKTEIANHVSIKAVFACEIFKYSHFKNQVTNQHFDWALPKQYRQALHTAKLFAGFDLGVNQLEFKFQCSNFKFDLACAKPGGDLHMVRNYIGRVCCVGSAKCEEDQMHHYYRSGKRVLENFNLCCYECVSRLGDYVYADLGIEGEEVIPTQIRALKALLSDPKRKFILKLQRFYQNLCFSAGGMRELLELIYMYDLDSYTIFNRNEIFVTNVKIGMKVDYLVKKYASIVEYEIEDNKRQQKEKIEEHTEIFKDLISKASSWQIGEHLDAAGVVKRGKWLDTRFDYLDLSNKSQPSVERANRVIKKAKQEVIRKKYAVDVMHHSILNEFPSVRDVCDCPHVDYSGVRRFRTRSVGNEYKPYKVTRKEQLEVRKKPDVLERKRWRMRREEQLYRGDLPVLFKERVSYTAEIKDIPIVKRRGVYTGGPGEVLLDTAQNVEEAIVSQRVFDTHNVASHVNESGIKKLYVYTGNCKVCNILQNSAYPNPIISQDGDTLVNVDKPTGQEICVKYAQLEMSIDDQRNNLMLLKRELRVETSSKYKEINEDALKATGKLNPTMTTFNVGGIVGVPGSGKTTKAVEIVPPDYVFVTPYARLTAEYREKGRRAYTFIAAMSKKLEKVALDEVYAMSPGVLTFYLNSAREVILIGDPRQMACVDKSNLYGGMKVADLVDSSKFDELNISYTVPLDVVHILNKHYGYNMKTFSKVVRSLNVTNRPGMQFDYCFTSDYEQMHRGTRVVAKIQGMRIKRANLLIESTARFLVENAFGQMVVAISRHTEKLNIHVQPGDDRIFKDITTMVWKHHCVLSGPADRFLDNKAFMFDEVIFDQNADPKLIQSLQEVEDRTKRILALKEDYVVQPSLCVPKEEPQKVMTQQETEQDENGEVAHRRLIASIPESFDRTYSNFVGPLQDTCLPTGADVVREEVVQNFRNREQIFPEYAETEVQEVESILEEISKSNEAGQHFCAVTQYNFSQDFDNFQVRNVEEIPDDQPMQQARLPVGLRGRPFYQACKSQTFQTALQRYATKRGERLSVLRRKNKSLASNMFMSFIQHLKHIAPISHDTIMLCVAEQLRKISEKKEVQNFEMDGTYEQTEKITHFVKQQVKADLKDDAWIRMDANGQTIKCGQGISAQPKSINAIAGGIIRAFEKHLKSCFKDYVVIPFGLSNEELDFEVAQRYDNGRKSLCTDISEMDKQRGKVTKDFMGLLYDAFGVDKSIYRLMDALNDKWTLDARSIKVRVDECFQSGRSDTLISNTCVAIGMVSLMFKLQDINLLMAQGDDFYAQARKCTYVDNYDFLKQDEQIVGDFVGYLIYEGISLDTPRLVVKLLNRIYGNQAALVEYQMAVRQWLVVIPNAERMHLNSVLVSTRYGISIPKAKYLLSFLVNFAFHQHPTDFFLKKSQNNTMFELERIDRPFFEFKPQE